MKLTDVQLVERAKIEGGVNFICDSGIGKKYDYRLVAYCENPEYGNWFFTVSIYFNDGMSDELYHAIKECLGNALFEDMEKLNSKFYSLFISPTQRITADKLVDYINKHTTSSKHTTSLFKVLYEKEGQGYYMWNSNK